MTNTGTIAAIPHAPPRHGAHELRGAHRDADATLAFTNLTYTLNAGTTFPGAGEIRIDGFATLDAKTT